MKDVFKHQIAVDPKGLARYFTALAEAVEEGRLPLTEGERSVLLHPRGLIDLGFKARRKNGRGRVLLEITWAEEEPDWPLLGDPGPDS